MLGAITHMRHININPLWIAVVCRTRREAFVKNYKMHREQSCRGVTNVKTLKKFTQPSVEFTVKAEIFLTLITGTTMSTCGVKRV